MPELEVDEVAGSGAVAAIGRALCARRDELRACPVTRIYGAALTATHVASLIFFWRHDFLVRTITGDDAVCWPFLPGCASWRTHSAAAVHASMVVYGVLALATMIAFVRREHAGKALLGLTALGLIKGAWFLHDYRLMGNYHYMPFIVSAVFLLVPRAKDTCRYMLVAFYLSAGVLKLDREWLSGAALIAPTWLTGRWLELGCALVVILELVVSLGLLARARRVRWGALLAFTVFHLYSWHVVGFFYPTVMFALLAIFPLAWLAEPDALGERLVRGRAGGWTYAALAVYAAAQVAPQLFPGDTAVTGEGRIFAINMMDARVACDHFSVARTGDGTWREVSDLHPRVGVRIQCDPIRYVSLARRACKQLGPTATYLNAKRTTGASYQQVFAVDDACDLRFSTWSHNPWIATP